jgi:REP element-mobilizing transposase RayT
VTLRALPSLRSLRSRTLASALQDALSASSRNGFRVLQFSIQKDHLHLITEADTVARFALGMQGLSIRLARAINRVLGRHGRVWSDRYHSRLLRTPREVRNALVYVLNNVRKHVPGVGGIDSCSSARWFGGWNGMTPLASTAPVAAARTWLAAVGWRRYGRLRIDEAPSPLR